MKDFRVTRRMHRGLALALACLISCAVLAASGQADSAPERAASEPTERPNIVFVVTDDLDAASVKRLPRLRSLLGKEGTTFRNAFVTDPLCCPSRSTILRGQYVHNHGVKSQNGPKGGYEGFKRRGHEHSTVATWLDSGGYRTALVGKYLNGYAERRVPPGWDEWYAWSGKRMSHRLNENGTARYYAPSRHHSTDVLSDKAVEFVRRSSEGGEPFFLYLGYNAPHQPAVPAPRHKGRFDGVRLPRPPSFDERDVSDKPRWIRDGDPLRQSEISGMTDLYRDRLESMLSVEDGLARLISELRASGELENTYIFFTSDNGFHMGQHRLGPGKMTAYEEDIRVPLMVRGPNVPAGRSVGQIALNNDLAPTFAQLAGVPTPSFVDGRSLVPLLGGGAPPRWRKSFLVENYRVPTPSGLWPAPTNFALRAQNYTYVRYNSGEREYYDLRKDPYQLKSLHDRLGRDRKAKLDSRLRDLLHCSGASCRTAEDR